MLDEYGKPIRVIRATPDADPGYRPGISVPILWKFGKVTS